MISKYDIPLDLVKAIEAIAKQNLDIIKLDKKENTYYSFVGLNPNSTNYFDIYIDGKKVIGNFRGQGYAFAKKPANPSSNKRLLSQSEITDVVKSFTQWIEQIRETESIQSLHDDPVTQKYEDYYFDQFEILDEDANIAPFNPDQQNVIDLYLNILCIEIEKNKEKLGDEAMKELNLFIQDIDQNLSTLPKNNIMQQLSKIFAIIQKKSRKLASEIFEQTKKELIKKLVKLGIEYGTKLIALIS